MNRNLHNRHLPLIVLSIITILNIGIIIGFFVANISAAALSLNGPLIYVLVGLELAAVFFALAVNSRIKDTVSF